MSETKSFATYAASASLEATRASQPARTPIYPNELRKRFAKAASELLA